MHVFTLYFLDSHDYYKKLPWAKPDYDYLKPSQIEWYRNISASIKPIERPFRPDGGEDLGHVWRSRQLAKPNAIMWFHIPLPEAYNPADSGPDGEQTLGDQFDGEGSSKHNSGFFEVLKKPETDVKILSHGHCHNTDRCRRVDGVW